jgi:hypothetical protein
MPDIIRDDLDRPLWGAEQIGRAAGLLNDDGTVDLRKVYYHLENKHLPADKAGKQWISSTRRILRVFTGESA